MLDTVDCVRAQGVESKAEFGIDNAGNLTFQTIYAASEKAEEIYFPCEDEHLSYVGQAWAEVVSDPDVERRFDAILLSCLKEHDLDVDHSKAGETQEHAYETDPAQLDSCFDEAEKIYEE